MNEKDPRQPDIGQDQEPVVEIIPTIAPAEGVLAKFRAWLDSRKIQIVKTPQQEDDIADLVRILSNETSTDSIDKSITILDDISSNNSHAEDVGIVLLDENELRTTEDSVEIGLEAAARLAVDAQMNIAAAQVFMSNVRTATPRMLQEQGFSPRGVDYENNAWYDMTELTTLADRWQIPIFVIRVNGNHWVLALNEPQLVDGKYQVLIYDPIKGRERSYTLPDWDNSYSFENLLTHTAAVNKLFLAKRASGERYDLTLFGDTELANTENGLEAKTTAVQFDGYNCGPACLFMAALRAGVRKTEPEEFNEFNFSGKSQLFNDTGVHVLSREDIIETVSE